MLIKLRKIKKILGLYAMKEQVGQNPAHLAIDMIDEVIDEMEEKNRTPKRAAH